MVRNWREMAIAYHSEGTTPKPQPFRRNRIRLGTRPLVVYAQHPRERGMLDRVKAFLKKVGYSFEEEKRKGIVSLRLRRLAEQEHFLKRSLPTLPRGTKKDKVEEYLRFLEVRLKGRPRIPFVPRERNFEP